MTDCGRDLWMADKIICPCCSGKGGFKNNKNGALGIDWADCPICEGYGFTDKQEDKSGEYFEYREAIIDNIYNLADVDFIVSETLESDMKIVVVPKDRRVWKNFLRAILRLSYHDTRVQILPRQTFYYDQESDRPYHSFWEIQIEMMQMSDLDGFIDLLKAYNEGDGLYF